MAPGSDGKGYWLLNAVGQVWTIGNVRYYGDVYKPSGSIATGIASSSPLLGKPRGSNTIKETSASAMTAALEKQARWLTGVG